MLLLLAQSFGLGADILVVDQKTGLPLPGVNITIVGTVEGMNTDLNGYFLLDSNHQNRELKFSYMGYLDTTLSYSEVLVLQVIQLQPDVLSLGEVEVVSSKLEWEQADLPSIITVLRTRELVNQGSIEIKEALQRDPSVVVDESVTGKHEISIRGSNANEVLIIYDGIPLNSSYAGGFDLSWLNLNDIESISIIKGAGTLRYGSGAFGGVLLLKPVQSGASGISMNYQTTDRHLKSFSVSDVLQLGSLRTRLTYSGQEHLPLGYYNDEITSQREFINLYASYALKDSTNSFSFNHIDIAETVDPWTSYEKQLSDTYTQLKYSGDLFGVMNTTVQLLKRNKGDQLSDLTDPRFEFSNIIDEQTELASIESKVVSKAIINLVKLEMKQDFFSGVSTTRNVTWAHDEHHEIALTQKWIALTDIFKYRTEIEVPFVDFIELNTSFRYDNIELDKTHKAFFDSVNYINETISDNHKQVSRRSGVTLSKKQKNLRYQLFYTAGTNLRYPSMNDLYLRDHTTIVIYQDSPLTPELNSSSEFGLQASIQSVNQQSILENIDVQASIFKNRYSDKIYYKQIPRALPTPLNMPSTQLGGFEMSIMSSLLNDRLRLLAGTSRLNISSYTIFPNKPKFRDVVEVDLNHHRGTLRLQYFHEGKQFYGGSVDNINWIVTELPSRENLNLYSSFKLILAEKEYVIGLTALNLLSSKDEQNYFNQRKWTLNFSVRL